MKSTELRIGNFFDEIQNGVHYGTHVACAISHIGVSNSFGKLIPFNQIEPIPLTEEILLKCGFDPNKYNDEFKLQPLTLDCEYTDYGEWNILYDRYPLDTEIKHLHQLQNLYFALTGEELNIEL